MAYTRLQRSLKARAQLRDRKGRWITMFGPVKFFINGLERLGSVIDIDTDNNRVTVKDRSDGTTHFLSPKDLTAIHAKGTLSERLHRKKASLDKPNPPTYHNLRQDPKNHKILRNADGDSFTHVSANSGTENAPKVFDAMDAPHKTVIPSDDPKHLLSPDTDLKTFKPSEPTDRDFNQATHIALTNALVGNPDSHNPSKNYGLSRDSDGNLVHSDFDHSFTDKNSAPTNLDKQIDSNPYLQDASPEDWRNASRTLSSITDDDFKEMFPNDPDTVKELSRRRDALLKKSEKDWGYNPRVETDDRTPLNADKFTKGDNNTLVDPDTDSVYTPTEHKNLADAQNSVLSSKLRSLADPSHTEREYLAYRNGKLTTLRTTSPDTTDYVSAPDTTDSKLSDLYAVDAWLDSRGYTDFNTHFDSQGNAIRSDFGGDLNHTPSGAKKKTDLASNMKSFSELRNPDASKVGLERSYEDLTDSQAAESLNKLSKVSDIDIDKAVSSVLGDSSEASKLSQDLKIRRDNALSLASTLSSDKHLSTPNSKHEAKKKSTSYNNLSKAKSGSKVNNGQDTFFKQEDGNWVSDKGDTFTTESLHDILSQSKRKPKLTPAGPNRDKPTRKTKDTSSFKSTAHLAREGKMRLDDPDTFTKNGGLEALPVGSTITVGDKDYTKTLFGSFKSKDGSKFDPKTQKPDQVYVDKSQAGLLADRMASRGIGVTNYALDNPDDLKMLPHAPEGSSVYSKLDPQRKFLKQEDNSWLAPNGSYVTSTDQSIANLVDQKWLKENYGASTGATLNTPSPTSHIDHPITIKPTKSIDNLPDGTVAHFDDGSTSVFDKNTGSFHPSRDFKDATALSVPQNAVPEGSEISAPSKDLLDNAPIGSHLDYQGNIFKKESDGSFRDSKGKRLPNNYDPTDRDYVKLPDNSTTKPTPENDSTIAKPDSPADKINAPQTTPSQPQDIDSPIMPEPKKAPNLKPSDAIDFGPDNGNNLSHENFEKLSKSPGFTKTPEGNLRVTDTDKALKSIKDVDPTTVDGELLHNTLNKAKDANVEISPQKPTTSNHTFSPDKGSEFEGLLHLQTSKATDSGFYHGPNGFQVTDYQKAYDTLTKVWDSSSSDSARNDISKMQDKLFEDIQAKNVPDNPIKDIKALNSSDVRKRINTKLNQSHKNGEDTGFDMSSNDIRIADRDLAASTLRNYAQGLPASDEVRKSLNNLASTIEQDRDRVYRPEGVAPQTSLSNTSLNLLKKDYAKASRNKEDHGFFFDKDGNLKITDPGKASNSFNKATRSASSLSGNHVDSKDKDRYTKSARELRDLTKESSLRANPDIEKDDNDGRTDKSGVGPSSPEGLDTPSADKVPERPKRDTGDGGRAERVRFVGDATSLDFQKAISEIKKTSHGQAVDVSDISDYDEMSKFLTPSHGAGFALKHGDELVSVFNTGKDGKGLGNTLVNQAVENGAKRLDCYDINGGLPRLYSRNGFKPVARMKWDDDYAPDGWDYDKNGRPDVVFMAFDKSRIGSVYDPKEGDYIDDYDLGIEMAKKAATSSINKKTATSLEEAGIPRTKHDKLPSEKYAPTQEQSDVIDAVDSGKNVAVQALAGSGKTSSVQQITERFPEGKEALYLVFNKANADEANAKLPGNTRAMTGHSLAYKWAKDNNYGFLTKKMSKTQPPNVGKQLGLKSRQNVGTELDRWGNTKNLDMTPQSLFNTAKRAVGNYQNSGRDKISIDDFKEIGITPNTPADTDYLLDAASKIWKDYMDPKGVLPTQHDTYRKVWAKSKPDLSKDSGFGPRQALFVDESQDTPSVLGELLRSQKNLQLISVGDTNQSIYKSFTGTEDFLKNSNADIELPLTGSFRFGPEIADTGQSFLDLLSTPNTKPLRGLGESGSVSSHISDPDAILVRTNASIVPEIGKALLEGRSNIAVPKNTRNNLVQMTETAMKLKGGPNTSNLHSDMKHLKDWDDLLTDLDNGNKSLTLPARLFDDMSPEDLKDFRNSLNSIYEPFQGKINPGNNTADWNAYSLGTSYGVLDKSKWTKTNRMYHTSDKEEFKKLNDLINKNQSVIDDPDMTISTAHKSKGLEWDRVQLGEDFKKPTKDKPLSDEELQLLYVASTRARKELGLGSADWVMDNKRDITHRNDHSTDHKTPNPDRLKKAEADATKCSIQSSALSVDSCPFGGDTGFTTNDDGSIDVHDKDRASKSLKDLKDDTDRERDNEDDDKKKKDLKEESDSLDKMIKDLDSDKDKDERSKEDRLRDYMNDDDSDTSKDRDDDDDDSDSDEEKSKKKKKYKPKNRDWPSGFPGNFPSGLGMLGGLPLLKKKKKKESPKGKGNPSGGTPNGGNPNGGNGNPNPNSNKGRGNPNPNKGNGHGNPNPNPNPFFGMPQFTPFELEYPTPEQQRPDLNPGSWDTPNLVSKSDTLNSPNTQGEYAALDRLTRDNQVLPADVPVRALTDSDTRLNLPEVNYVPVDTAPQRSVDISTREDTNRPSTPTPLYSMTNPQSSKTFGGVVDLISSDSETATSLVQVPGVGPRTVSTSSLTPIKKTTGHNSTENGSLVTSWGEPITVGDTISLLSASQESPNTKFGSSQYTVLSSTPDGKYIVAAATESLTTTGSTVSPKLISTDSISDIEPHSFKDSSVITNALKENAQSISNLSHNTPQQRAIVSIYSDTYPVSKYSDIPSLSVKTGEDTLHTNSLITPESIDSIADNSMLFINNIPYKYSTKNKSASPVFSTLSSQAQEADIPEHVLSNMIQSGHSVSLYTNASNIHGTDLGESPSTQDLMDLPVNSTITLPTKVNGGYTGSATKVGSDLWSVDYLQPTYLHPSNTKQENSTDPVTPIGNIPSNATDKLLLSSDQLQNYLPSLALDTTPQFSMPSVVDSLDEARVGSSFNLDQSPFYGVSGIAIRTSADTWDVKTESGTTSITHSDLQDYMSEAGDRFSQITFNTPVSRTSKDSYIPGTQIIDPVTGSIFTVNSDGKYLREGTDTPLNSLPQLSAGAFSRTPDPDTIISTIAEGGASSLPAGTITSGISGTYLAQKLPNGEWEVYAPEAPSSRFTATNTQLERLVNSGSTFQPNAPRRLTSGGRQFVLNQTVSSSEGRGVITALNSDSDSAVILLDNGKTIIAALEDLNLGDPNIVDSSLKNLAEGTPNPLPAPNPMPNPMPNPLGTRGQGSNQSSNKISFTADQKKNDPTLNYPVVQSFSEASQLVKSSTPRNPVFDDPEVAAQYKAIKKAVQSRLKGMNPNQFLPSADRITAAQISELFSAEVLDHLNDPLPITTSRGDLINSSGRTIGDMLVSSGVITPDEYSALDSTIKVAEQGDAFKRKAGRSKGTPYRKRLRFHQESYYDRVLHMDGNIFVLKGTDSAIEPVRKDTFEAANNYLNSVIDTQDFSEYTPEISQYLRKKTAPAGSDLLHLEKSDLRDTASELDKKFVNNPSSFYSNTMTKAHSFKRPDGTPVGSREELRTLVGSLISDYGYLEVDPGMDVVYNADPQFNDIKLNVRTAGGTPLMYNGEKVLLPRGTSLYIDFIDAGPDMDTVWVEIVPNGWVPPQVIEG